MGGRKAACFRAPVAQSRERKQPYINTVSTKGALRGVLRAGKANVELDRALTGSGGKLWDLMGFSGIGPVPTCKPALGGREQYSRQSG